MQNTTSTTRISCYERNTAKVNRPVALSAVLTGIANGQWQQQVEAVRTAYSQGGKAAARPAKDSLSAVTFSGLFNGPHKADCLTEHTGLLIVDFDDLADRLQAARTAIEHDPHTKTVFVSPTGSGLKVLVRIPADPAGHERAFDTVARYFQDQHGLTADASGRDVCRLCYVSFDPDLYQNDAAQMFVIPAQLSAAHTGGSVDLDAALRRFDSEVRQRLVAAGLAPGAAVACKGDDGARGFRIDCLCPWRDQHSDGNGGAAVFIWGGNHYGFKCFHAHCTSRDWQSVVRTIGDSVVDPVAAAAMGAPYARTDLGNAERLVAYHGGNIRWDTARKIWRVWDGQRWAADTALRIGTLCAESARKIKMEAAQMAASTDQERSAAVELFKHAVRSESRDRLAAMAEVAKSHPGVAVSAEAFDSDLWLLNCANGTIDLRTGTLQPHNRADLLTKITPVEYHPGRKCERFERFLLDGTGGDVALVQFLQVAAGYTLTGMTTEEVLFLVYGPEASGKTTLLECLRSAVGEYARTIHGDLLARQKDSKGGGAASPELAGLAGARMAVGSEMEQGRELAEALAKNLTGGEAITARHLYAEMFDYQPQFKIWLALNHCPKVSADDGAIWRRILRIGFEHTVPPERRDKSLKPYLRNPTGGAPAVLAWAVEGCLRWQREGLRIPDAVTRSTAAYRQESDPLASFFEDCLIFNPSAWTSWSGIWEAYNEHAGENGTAERYRVAPKRLQERLRGKDCQSDRRRIGRGWSGVEVVVDWQTGARDGCDGCDTISKTFPSNSLLGKLSEKASQASQASQDTFQDLTEEELF